MLSGPLSLSWVLQLSQRLEFACVFVCVQCVWVWVFSQISALTKKSTKKQVGRSYLPCFCHELCPPTTPLFLDDFISPAALGRPLAGVLIPRFAVGTGSTERLRNENNTFVAVSPQELWHLYSQLLYVALWT